MPALNSDLLKKVSRRLITQIGAAGVSDNVVTTIPLSSTTNFPTTTAVVVTIDRVDVNGVATPSLEESIIGVVSGANLINCTRGVEGTAQAHSAGAVAEILITAKGYNDIIDAFLVGHTQLGAHGASSIVASNIAASAVTAGALAASAVVAGDMAASSVVLGNLAASAVVAGTIAASAIVAGNLAASAVVFGNLGFPVAQKRIVTVTQSATPTINTDITDVAYITGLAQAINTMTTNLSGTPAEGNTLRISITDNGTARAITWGASFESSGGTVLPTTTVLSTRLDVGFLWNSITTKWRCVATS